MHQLGCPCLRLRVVQVEVVVQPALCAAWQKANFVIGAGQDSGAGDHLQPWRFVLVAAGLDAWRLEGQIGKRSKTRSLLRAQDTGHVVSRSGLQKVK
jgi:hypothetical protein